MCTYLRHRGRLRRDQVLVHVRDGRHRQLGPQSQQPVVVDQDLTLAVGVVGAAGAVRAVGAVGALWGRGPQEVADTMLVGGKGCCSNAVAGLLAGHRGFRQWRTWGRRFFTLRFPKTHTITHTAHTSHTCEA